jgi:hypothetical protein
MEPISDSHMVHQSVHLPTLCDPGPMMGRTGASGVDILFFLR